jgi:hypothetical protein
VSRSLFLAVFLLSGCVSYTQMQERPPALEFQSTKTPGAYAACVSPKFMDIWPGQVALIPDGDKTVVTVAGPSGAPGAGMTATLTITSETSGSHVVLREMPHINIGSGFKRAQDAAQSCK